MINLFTIKLITICNQRYFTGFLLAEKIYRLMFIQNASTKYTISGEPIVKKEIYTNHVRMRDVAIPILSPMAVQTPNACHSIKCFILFIMRN
jgi:hypothetical protein